MVEPDAFGHWLQVIGVCGGLFAAIEFLGLFNHQPNWLALIISEIVCTILVTVGRKIFFHSYARGHAWRVSNGPNATDPTQLEELGPGLHLLRKGTTVLRVHPMGEVTFDLSQMAISGAPSQSPPFKAFTVSVRFHNDSPTASDIRTFKVWLYYVEGGIQNSLAEDGTLFGAHSGPYWIAILKQMLSDFNCPNFVTPYFHVGKTKYLLNEHGPSPEAA